MILKDREGTARCKVGDPQKDLLMRTGLFKLYMAERIESGTELAGNALLRLASSSYDNGLINSEAEWLKRIMQASDDIEEYASEHGATKPIHYDWLIPRIRETFITGEDQKYRQANLLDFLDVDAGELFPLPKLKDYCMIDCKTAAWVLGRYLKLQVFLENIRIQYTLHPIHVLISPPKHRLIYLGLILEMMNKTELQTETEIPPERSMMNIMAAARDVLEWIEPEQLKVETEFAELVQDLKENGRKSGKEAHKDFYDEVDRMWGIKYHPFTYYIKSQNVWKHDNEPIIE